MNFLIFTRAVLICDRTVDSDEPRMVATSAVVRPSRSRNTRAARSLAGRSDRANGGTHEAANSLSLDLHAGDATV